MPIDQNEVLAQKTQLAAVNQVNILKIQMEILLQDHFLAMKYKNSNYFNNF